MRYISLIAALLALVFVPRVFAESSLNELLGEAAEQNRQVAALAKAGKYREAVPHSRKSLEIWETVLGDDHPNIVHRLNGLAALHEALEEYGESESLYRRALSIREKTFGNNHPAVAEILTHLGRVCRAQGKYGEAEALERRAAEMRGKAGKDLIMPEKGKN